MKPNEALHKLIKRLEKFVERNGITEYAREQEDIINTLLAQNARVEKMEMQIDLLKNKCKLLCALLDAPEELSELPNEFIVDFIEGNISFDYRNLWYGGEEMPESKNKIDNILYLWRNYKSDLDLYRNIEDTMRELPPFSPTRIELYKSMYNILFWSEIENNSYDESTR